MFELSLIHFFSDEILEFQDFRTLAIFNSEGQNAKDLALRKISLPACCISLPNTRFEKTTEQAIAEYRKHRKGYYSIVEPKIITMWLDSYLCWYKVYLLAEINDRIVVSEKINIEAILPEEYHLCA